MHKVLRHRDGVYRMYAKKRREEEDLQALKRVLTPQYNNLENTYRNIEEDWLQPPEEY